MGGQMRTITYAEAEADRTTCGDVVLWGQDGDESLALDDLDAAIEDALDGKEPPWTGTIEMIGYARETLRPEDTDAQAILAPLLESIDEIYGHPDDDATEPTPAMTAAAEALGRAVRADYEVWLCRPVVTVLVDAAAWVAEHRPDWLEGRDA